MKSKKKKLDFYMKAFSFFWQEIFKIDIIDYVILYYNL